MKTKSKAGRIIFSIFLWAYAVFSLYPLVWMIFYSFKNNQEIFVTNPYGIPTTFRWENYVNAWNKYDVPTYFFNSILVATGTVIITLLCALLFSYATCRMEFKGRGALAILVSTGMFIPVQAILIPLVKIVQGLQLSDTRWSLILPYVAINLAFSTMVYHGFLKGIPLELEEAACIDGANIYQTFFKIIAPLVRPATATLAIYVFLAAWNEFILANVLVGSNAALKTLPLGVLFFQGQFTTDWGGMGATMVIASLPAILIYIIFSDKVEKAMTIGGAVKG
ncbi:carbohydrate ABC transporter permease [Konateibacter massiliensis]|uniref:carbohydrate ABC transporter permease n=1 Tax=Konateibacter massiliensis TaxID=2002841 RepID=UPI000C1566B6|nr:carbohydrate ABC transporter permease [Konateibacter massiliensis]